MNVPKTSLAMLPAAVLLALIASAPAASAAWADDPQQIIDDCGDSGLPDEVVSYCLRNLHRLNETSPTAESEALEAQLQRRADGLDRDDDRDAPPPDRSDRDDSSNDDSNKSDDIAGPNDQNPPGYDDDRPPPNDSDSDADSDQDNDEDTDDEPPPPLPQRPQGY